MEVKDQLILQTTRQLEVLLETDINNNMPVSILLIQ